VEREHVVAAYGERWKQLSAWVRTVDPHGRMINPFFQELLWPRHGQYYFGEMQALSRFPRIHGQALRRAARRGAWGPVYFAPMGLTGRRSESVMRTSALENRSGAIVSHILGGDGEAEGEADVLTIM
jgi:hypothetical protein